MKRNGLKKIKPIWGFYKSYLLASSTITACCLILFREYGFSIFFNIFWFKVASLALIFYFMDAYKQNEYYYYHNLGISKGLLWTASLLFDLVLFLFLIGQIHQLK